MEGEIMKNIHLLAIDVQNDFCDRYGALYVKGAERDTTRLSVFVNRMIYDIDSIHVTLDSHHLVDIAHSVFWINDEGDNPPPRTIISEEDVVSGVWKASDKTLIDKAIKYVKQLSANGRYPLCIWPNHCIFGSRGWTIQEPFIYSLEEWSRRRVRNVDYHIKGLNMMTEHYSAFKADVIDEADPSTLPNIELVKQLLNADEILVAGQARSHCVNYSVRDLIDAFGRERAEKFVLLTDAMSDVPGFEHLGEKFQKDMIDMGVRIATTENYFG
jgi:nicotinamidase/pyrazinamidase